MAISSKRVRWTPRERSKMRIRKRVQGSEQRPRMSVFKSVQHIYAQVISDLNGKTIASASTLDKEVQQEIGSLSPEGIHSQSKSSKSVIAAKAVGVVIAKRAKAAGVDKIVFDRSGYVFHGRIKAVADGAREAGLEF